jgi:hypothetical protein
VLQAVVASTLSPPRRTVIDTLLQSRDALCAQRSPDVSPLNQFTDQPRHVALRLHWNWLGAGVRTWNSGRD